MTLIYPPPSRLKDTRLSYFSASLELAIIVTIIITYYKYIVIIVTSITNIFLVNFSTPYLIRATSDF